MNLPKSKAEIRKAETLKLADGTLNPSGARPAPLGKIMFPYPHDTPAEFAQLAVHPAVTHLVGGELLFPESTVAGRNFTMLGATVPETPVHKQCQPVPPKKKIRFAENILIPAPAGDVVPAEQCYQREFGVFVSLPANPGHNSRTLFFGENISHETNCGTQRKKFQPSLESFLTPCCAFRAACPNSSRRRNRPAPAAATLSTTCPSELQVPRPCASH